jgi:hypothetical protein
VIGGKDLLTLKKYDSGIHPTLCYYMALAGLTLDQVAAVLGILPRLLDAWIARHPELKEAMKPGKDFVDNLVEGSLLKRAMGYDVVEVTRENVEVQRDPVTGKVKYAMKTTKRVTKHIPGEVGAQCFWLKNRKGWRDRVDMIHGGSITHKQDLSRLSDEELATMRALAAKAEANASAN